MTSYMRAVWPAPRRPLYYINGKQVTREAYWAKAGEQLLSCFQTVAHRNGSIRHYSEGQDRKG